MKKFHKYIAFGALASLLCVSATSCLEEDYPESSYFTEEQIADADKTALVRAIPAYYNYYSTDDTWDIGFAMFLAIRDTQTADCPLYSITYDYYSHMGYQLGIGNSQLMTVVWRRHYYMLLRCNNVIRMCDTDPESADAKYLGNALAFRASTYLDMLRMYEYRKTDVAALDAQAEEDSIMGLTVPLVTENTTEEETRHMPRAPFYEMNRFIMNDLNNAETYLAKYPYPDSKDFMGLGMVYGLKARLWLELGSRFERYPADLAQQMQMESEYADYAPLGISSATQCYAKAAEYARKAINMGYTPTTKSQWFDPSTGFNTPTNSWIHCIIITPDTDLAKYMTWQSWVSNRSPEATYGVSSAVYQAYRMIDARLYSEMADGDWRRTTWIDPNDVGSQTAFEQKYAAGTNLDYSMWSEFTAYTGFKFHPASGNIDVASTGNAVSIPLMRVEEMYLIEAEAAAHSQGAGAGKQLLESFMNNYRMEDGKTFTAPSDLDGVVDAIFTQKRIEFWGEGVTAWDYRRLEKQVVKGYPGTNHPESYRYNSMPNAVAPWLNFYIPDRVHNLNPLAKLNPDPSNAIPTLWKE